ncbi:hypothetical protein V2J09_012956 [Rumex salicifolius]
MLSSLSSGFRVSNSSPSRHHHAIIRPEAPDQARLVVSNASHSSSLYTKLLQKSLLPLVASTAICLCPCPAEAGFMSGSTGIESIPGPELPSIDFLKRFNEENQKKYTENDERFKSSPIIKELLERSKQNKEKNKQEIFDKYCLRGAEWGVGDCSTAGMTEQERDAFIAMLKQKAASPK